MTRNEDSYYTNRTMCEVLAEMRTCYKTRNFAPLLGLIEEVQIMGERMESALADQSDIKKLNEEWHELKKKVKKLRKKRDALKK